MSCFKQTGLRALTVLSAIVFLTSCGGGDSAPADPAPVPAPGPAPRPAPGPAPSPGADTQAPTVSLTSPMNLVTGLAGTLSLSANATDNVGVTGVEFQVDGAPVGATLSAPPFAASLDTNGYASGQHVLRVQARDAAGNLSAWSSATVQFAGSRTQPAGFTRTTLVSGLSTSTAFAQAPDGRMFVAQQGGALRVVSAAGTLLPTAALQLLNIDSTGERGLIGVTVDPSFATNGFIYLYYTTQAGGTHNRISRFTLVPPSSNIVSAGSELPLMELPALSNTNHNGGALHFGAGGKLYVGVGDNGVSSNAPSNSTRFGKMLRINSDGSIPTDNPFFGSLTGDNRAIWANGLRNPFTFAVQPVTGKIYINDVGQDTWEEINLGAAGANYGWPATEGPTSAAGVSAPLFSYKHSAAAPEGSGPGGFFTGKAIIGGAFYPDSGPFPAIYRGSYFFADLESAFVARYDSANSAAYSFGAVADAPVGMLTGNDGALYVLTLTTIVRFSSP